MARDLLVYFYQRYFAAPANRPRSRDPFRFTRPVADLARSFRGDDYRQDLIQLKTLLAAMGTRPRHILVNKHPEVVECQMVCSFAYAVSEQNADNGTIVTAPTCDRAAAAERICAAAQARLGATVQVEVRFVDEIALTPAGKLRFIINEVAPL